MRLDLSSHARRRMKLRHISEADIILVLEDFKQKSWPNNSGTGTVVVSTIREGFEVAVVVEGRRPFSEPVRVITVYPRGEEDE